MNKVCREFLLINKRSLALVKKMLKEKFAAGLTLKSIPIILIIIFFTRNSYNNSLVSKTLQSCIILTVAIIIATTLLISISPHKRSTYTKQISDWQFRIAVIVITVAIVIYSTALGTAALRGLTGLNSVYTQYGSHETKTYQVKKYVKAHRKGSYRIYITRQNEEFDFVVPVSEEEDLKNSDSIIVTTKQGWLGWKLKINHQYK